MCCHCHTPLCDHPRTLLMTMYPALHSPPLRGRSHPMSSAPNPAHRFFVAAGAVTAAGVEFSAEQQQQIRRVLRLRDGDRVIACPGDGTELIVILRVAGQAVSGEIEAVRAGTARAEPPRLAVPERAAGRSVHLAAAEGDRNRRRRLRPGALPLHPGGGLRDEAGPLPGGGARSRRAVRAEHPAGGAAVRKSSRPHWRAPLPAPCACCSTRTSVLCR